MREYEADLQNHPVDVSEEFARQQNHFFIGSKVPYSDGRSPARQGRVDRARGSREA
jgi:hypothetical protein